MRSLHIFLRTEKGSIMEKLNVPLGERAYDIIFEKDFSALGKCLDDINAPEKILVITDKNVGGLYLDVVMSVISDSGRALVSCIFDAGEENKNIDTVIRLCKSCMDNELDRKSMIIALGGGVVGDMAGFCAALYMRGIDYVQIPTTLLSQSDSSVGGKTGVDFCGGKNLIGAFHQPRLVYINVSTLKTLPKREFISGMGEVIKHGIIKDKDFFDYIDENSEGLASLDSSLMIKLSKKNCKIKADVVAEDERESGLRRILNFGHTIGHAIESERDFKETHGQCVAYGMLCVLYISYKRGILKREELERVRNVLLKYGFGVSIKDADTEKIISLVKKDKKKNKNSVSFVLPSEIGRVFICDDVTDEEIADSIKYLIRGEEK